MYKMTTDEDLLDLAGYFVYQIQQVAKQGTSIESVMLNRKKFMITYYEDATGLNVIMATNAQTNEVSLIFAGSVDGKDWEQNILNAIGHVPQQFIAAKAYAQQQIDQGVKIVSGSGNSLGGPLAIYALGDQLGVEIVTLNPAPIPKGTQCLCTVRNYIVKQDLLYLLIQATNLDDRIVGEQIILDSCIYSYDDLIRNHIGLYQIDTLNKSSILAYSTADFIPFSLWHPNKVILCERQDEILKLDTGKIGLMAYRLVEQKETLRLVIRDNLTAIKRQIIQRQSSVEQAVTAIMSKYEQQFERQIELIKKERVTYQEQSVIVIKMMHQLKLGQLPSLIEQLGFGKQFVQLEQYIKEFHMILDEGTYGIGDHMLSKLQQLMCKFILTPGISTSLLRQCMQLTNKIENNVELTLQQWEVLEEEIDVVYQQMLVQDQQQQLCQTVHQELTMCQRNVCPDVQLDVQAVRKLYREVQHFSKAILSEQFSQASQNVVAALRAEIAPILDKLNHLKQLSQQIECILDDIDSVIASTTAKMMLFKLFKQLTLGATTDVASLRQLYSEMRKLIDYGQQVVCVVEQYDHVLPEIFQNLTPYVIEMIEPDVLLTTMDDKYKISLAIIERSRLSFGEMQSWLATEEQPALIDLGHKVTIVLGNIVQLIEMLRTIVMS